MLIILKDNGKVLSLRLCGSNKQLTILFDCRVLDKPQWHDLLPCKLGIWFCLTVKALPQLFQVIVMILSYITLFFLIVLLYIIRCVALVLMNFLAQAHTIYVYIKITLWRQI